VLYILGPGLVIAVAGVIAGGLASPFGNAASAARVGWWAAWGVAVTAGAAVVAAIALPDEPVLNGPIGATCPDTSSTLYDVLGGLAAASAVAGAAVIAAATVEVVKRAASEHTYGRVAVGVLVPYVALAALVIPFLCDYS
jgi:hypothetical protein